MGVTVWKAGYYFFPAINLKLVDSLCDITTIILVYTAQLFWAEVPKKHTKGLK